MSYDLTSGVFLYAERTSTQIVYTGWKPNFLSARCHEKFGISMDCILLTHML